MRETTSSGTNKVLVFLVVLLVAATAVQGFFLFRIYRGTQETEQTSAGSGIQLVPKASAAPANSKQSIQSPSASVNPFGSFSFDPDDSWLNWKMDDWDPFSEFQRMQQRMNRLFDDSFGRFRLTPGFGEKWSELSFSPRLDLREEDDRYVVSVDVPGAEKSNISVNIEDRQLTVSGQTDETVEERVGGQVLRKERRSGQFQRSITLPGPVHDEDMTAEYDNGVLTVTIPKGTETARSKTITIQ